MANDIAFYVDADRCELTGPDGLVRQVSEGCLAALLLLSLGYQPADLKAMLGSICRDSVSELRANGWRDDTVPVVTGSGLTLAPYRTVPEARHLCGHLSQRAINSPDDVSLVVEDPDSPDTDPFVLAAPDLQILVHAIAVRLAGEGLGPGDHIAVDARPRLESVLLCIAAWHAGVSVVPIRENLSADTLHALCERVRPKLWFGDLCRTLPTDARHVPFVSDGAEDFDSWLEQGAVAELPLPDAAREAVVLPSSGSTGAPKLIALSHRNLFSNAHVALFGGPSTSALRAASVTDLSAMSGLRTLAVLPALGVGTSVLFSETTRKSGLGCFLAFARHRITHAQVIPATLRTGAELGVERFKTLGLNNLALVASGTGVLHEDLRDTFAASFSCELRDSFGLNETAGSFAWSSDGSVGEVGAQCYNVLVRIVEPNGAACAPGETGQIRVFGENLFTGQYGVSGFEARPSGWFTTGDMGTRLPNGRVKITGRSHDLIKTVEGEFLSPVMVENAVVALEAIKEAVVIALPATEEGERYAIAATASGRSSAAEVRVRNCIRKRFGPFASPARILILNDLPRAAHGKPDRAKLREMSLIDA